MADRDKFVDLAEKRVNNALRAIRVIGNLSNANLYEYTEKDVSKIMAALRGELESVNARFKSGGGREKGSFTLK
jgi:hypothetical protein